MRSKLEKAMVLAAGYGTRLKPLTDRMPKPLVPVAGKPMIEYALEKLKAYGIKEVIINVSHHKDQLIAWLNSYKDLTIRISEEAEPLETGGGLKKALSLLGCDPFFTINSDILWVDESETASGTEGVPRACELQEGQTLTPTLSHRMGEGVRRTGEGRFMGSALDRLTRHWDESRMDILLLAQSRARAVGYDRGEDHLFIKPANTIEWNDQESPYIMAGIAILHPRLFQDSPDGKFSVKTLWHQALSRDRLFCLPHRGQWFQTGTLEDIKKAESILRGPS
jgi:MurNAc alpha-1-phosphate uridylyltransferase